MNWPTAFAIVGVSLMITVGVIYYMDYSRYDPSFNELLEQVIDQITIQ